MKKILITGASRGIGEATVERLLAAGHEVWGTSRSLDRLEERERFHSIAMSLENEDSVSEGIHQVLEESGGLDVLINNGGMSSFGPLEYQTGESERELFQILVHTPLLLIQESLPSLRERKGLIVNVSSLAARFPIPYMAAYSAAKAALTVYSRSLQIELSDSAIDVVDLQPGDIRTKFHEAMPQFREDAYADSLERTWESISKSMAEAPQPELVAHRIARLVEGRSRPRHLVVGDFFQGTIAPWGLRFLPTSWIDWIQLKYYGVR